MTGHDEATNEWSGHWTYEDADCEGCYLHDFVSLSWAASDRQDLTAMPRVLLSNKSTKTPPATASGLVPKNPAKKRLIRMLCRSFDTAVAK